MFSRMRSYFPLLLFSYSVMSDSLWLRNHSTLDFPVLHYLLPLPVIKSGVYLPPISIYIWNHFCEVKSLSVSGSCYCWSIALKIVWLRPGNSHCWVFQICWHIECSTLTASSFRIWNSSAGIPSPPLALFVVMLPESHLTLHSKTSGSMWVITVVTWVIEIIFV